MKILSLVLGVSLAACPLLAHGGTSCEDVKTAIAAKLDAKGVKNYTLEAVANADVGDKRVVGVCDGGTKKLAYARAVAP